jgi:uncharacterized membrane protein YidH (DUF202 family)
MKSLLAFFIITVGIGMFFAGLYFSADLHWSNPDATERRLWLDHATVMWQSTGLILGGFILMGASFFLKEADNYYFR